MSVKQKIVCLGLALLLGASAGAWAAKKDKKKEKAEPEVSSGAPPAMLAHSCMGCHNTYGASVGSSIPVIGGQVEQALIDSLTRFKRDERPATVMGRLMKGYSTEEIKGLAQFFSKQKMVRPAQADIKPDLVARGEKLQRRCKECHTRNGKGSDNDAPYIAGQWREYLERSMIEFLDRKRPYPDQMDDAFDGLTPEDIVAASHFFASQK